MPTRRGARGHALHRRPDRIPGRAAPRQANVIDLD
jgi:hypothetical protein